MENTKPKTEQIKIGMRGPGGFGGTGEKAKNFRKSLTELAKYLKAYWLHFILIVIFSIVSTIFTIVSPKILGNVTNDIVTDFIEYQAYDMITKNLPSGMKIPEGTKGETLLSKIPQDKLKDVPQNVLDTIKNLDITKKPQIDFEAISKTIIFLIGLYLLSLLFSFIQGLLMTNVTQKVTYKLRKEIFEKVARLPIKYFNDKAFGDVMSRITNDVDTISQNLNQSISQIVTSISTVIGILIMMLTISWEMTLVALLIIPISTVITILIVKKSQEYFKSQQAILGAINGQIEEDYSDHNIVKIFNAEESAISAFDRKNNSLFNNAWKSQFFSGLIFPIMNFVGNLGFVGVCVVGGYLAIKNSVSIGDIQAFIQYVRQFNQPIIQTANIANIMQSTVAAAERVFEFLSEIEEEPDIKTPKILDEVKGNIEFKNVTFGYNEDKIVINNFTASVKSGRRIAIVGPTGAGKTTLVNLLMRFYELNSGNITIDGIDTKDMKRSYLRSLFGMVLQDTWLFSGKIKENLKYGKPSATDEELMKITKVTHVDHFVKSLPDSYNMDINEDSENISQGEKQLLTIARAMLANPPILILDEATSSVDTRTEVLIQEAMETLMKGRTSFVIAHRLSTIRNADLILVMKDGNIVEQGNHEELLSKNGFYASIYNSQFVNEAE